MNTAQSKLICRICGNGRDNTPVVAKEMMFGWRDEFPYIQCAVCRCLQIVEFPERIADYYPPGYYSMQPPGMVKRWLRRRWAAYAFGRTSVLGWAITKVEGPHLASAALRRANVPPNGRILDVGCGDGHLLYDLQFSDYAALHGLDPFVTREFADERISLWRRTLSEHQGKYEAVMFNHSLEHMAEPQMALCDAARLLSNNGVVIVRIPWVDSEAWRLYGQHWASLDAPRHFFLLSRPSLEILAKGSGLKLASMFFESTMDQFLAGEQYRQGVPLTDARSFVHRKLRFLSWRREDRTFRRRASELNSNQLGDMVCVELRM